MKKEEPAGTGLGLGSDSLDPPIRARGDGNGCSGVLIQCQREAYRGGGSVHRVYKECTQSLHRVYTEFTQREPSTG